MRRPAPPQVKTATSPILDYSSCCESGAACAVEDLPRETRNTKPKESACPGCGGELRNLGEDVPEVLKYVPEHFKVIRQVRTKLSCTKCDCIVQAAAPSRPIERGVRGPGCRRMYWSRSMRTTCRSIPSSRFTRATAWSWNP